MYAKKIVLLLLAILSFSMLAAAQDNYYEQERDRLEAEERQKEITKKFEAATGITPFDLSYFLPKTKNSWFVSITATGGILGGTRLLAAVNSNGNYVCNHTEQDFQNQQLAQNAFDELSQKVAAFDFKKFNDSDADKIEGCSDCVYKILNYNNGKNTYRFNLQKFSLVNSELKNIYNQIVTSAPCG
jgi:hypothetical protein